MQALCSHDEEAKPAKAGVEFITKSMANHCCSQQMHNQWSAPHNIHAMYNHNVINFATLHIILSSLIAVLLPCTYSSMTKTMLRNI